MRILGVFLREGSFVKMTRLDPADFYSERHRAIFGAIKAVASDGLHPDIVTACEYLRRSRELELSGGEAYLMDLTDAAVSSAGWESYEKIVRDKARLRSCIDAARRLNESAFDDSRDIEEVINDFTAAATTLSTTDSTSGIMLQTLIRDYITDPEKLSRDVVTTGFDFLDSRLKIRPKQLGVIAARPGVGKTSLALQIAINVARSGEVMVDNLEMGEMEVALRIASQASGAESWRLEKLDRLTQQQKSVLANIGFDCDIRIFEERTVEGLRAAAQRRKAQGRLKLVIVDYLQFMEVTKATDSRATDVAKISRGLKRLAKELDVPVIALSQLSRESQKASDARPRLHHLRESGAIEQDADWVITIFEGEAANEWDVEAGNARFIECLKHRGGGTFGPIQVPWSGSTTSFGNCQ